MGFPRRVGVSEDPRSPSARDRGHPAKATADPLWEWKTRKATATATTEADSPWEWKIRKATATTNRFLELGFLEVGLRAEVILQELADLFKLRFA